MITLSFMFTLEEDHSQLSNTKLSESISIYTRNVILTKQTISGN
jgi:hypothetical protein